MAKSKEIEKLPIIIVHWIDHTADASWMTLENVKKFNAVMCQTVGWLVDDDDMVVRVADTMTADGEFGGINLILKSCITDIIEIEFSDPKVELFMKN